MWGAHTRQYSRTRRRAYSNDKRLANTSLRTRYDCRKTNEQRPKKRGLGRVLFAVSCRSRHVGRRWTLKTGPKKPIPNTEIRPRPRRFNGECCRHRFRISQPTDTVRGAVTVRNQTGANTVITRPKSGDRWTVFDRFDYRPPCFYCWRFIITIRPVSEIPHNVGGRDPNWSPFRRFVKTKTARLRRSY